MASVRRKPGTRYWICCYTNDGGAQCQRSSRSLNRADALALAQAYEAAFRQRQTEVQMRRVMAEIHEKMHGKTIYDLTLGVFADQWLVRVKAEIAPSTYVRYTGALSTVRKLAPGVFAKQLESVSTADLVELRAAVLGGRSVATTKTTMKPLAQVFKAAWRDGLMTDNPIVRLKPLRADVSAAGTKKRPFSPEELSKVWGVADDEWRGMIMAGYYTAGQRLGDIAGLTPAAFDLEQAVVRFRAGKTQRAVVLPISEPWLADLKRRVKGKGPNDPIFPRAARWAVKSVGKVSNSFRRLLAKVGLATTPNSRGRFKGRRVATLLSFHSFRHTATSRLKNAGVSDAIARDIVGHESAAVSAHYTHIDQDTKRAANEKSSWCIFFLALHG